MSQSNSVESAIEKGLAAAGAAVEIAGGVATTIEDVHAQSASLSSADVIKAQVAPAPSDPFEAFMARMSIDMAQVKAVLGLSEPLVNEAAAVAGALAPVAAPVLDRLPVLESAVNSIIGALQAAFADHPSLPASLPPPVAAPGA